MKRHGGNVVDVTFLLACGWLVHHLITFTVSAVAQEQVDRSVKAHLMTLYRQLDERVDALGHRVVDVEAQTLWVRELQSRAEETMRQWEVRTVVPEERRKWTVKRDWLMRPRGGTPPTSCGGT